MQRHRLSDQETTGEVDDNITDRSVDFIKHRMPPASCSSFWVTFTQMHMRTHSKPASRGQSGRFQSPYHVIMIDHDKNAPAGKEPN